MTVVADAGHPCVDDLVKAESASIYGSVKLGQNVRLAQGAILRSLAEGVAIGDHSMVLENCVVVGRFQSPTRIGSKTVFGHRTIVVGAVLGDLCEIGNNCIIMDGASIGSCCILGEGTLIPPGAEVPACSVVVGRPGRIVRSLTQADQVMLARMRGGDVSLTHTDQQIVQHWLAGESLMGRLYSYRGTLPQVAETAVLFDSAEITGDVIVGEECIIGAGVKIIGDSHGPVRIGNQVQILENTVLHLLPDNRLLIEDRVVIGPGCMIHGCEIGAGTVVEPGAIVCDYSKIGRNSLIRAGAVVKQRSHFPEGAILDGFPAMQVDTLLPQAPPFPSWALSLEDVRWMTRHTL